MIVTGTFLVFQNSSIINYYQNMRSLNSEIIPSQQLSKPTVYNTSLTSTTNTGPMETNIKIEAESLESTGSPESEMTKPEIGLYDPKLEMKKRKDGFDLYCKTRRKGIMNPNYLTGYISRWGVSLGGVTFWSCFTPKAASSSFSVAALVATGYIKKNDDSDDLDEKWDQGRNHCPRTDHSCLHQFADLPQRYRYMEQSMLPSDDLFTSITFVREPMSRLVSAWKNKIFGMGLQFYYTKAGRTILKRKYGKTQPIPLKGTDAFNKGMRIEFKGTWRRYHRLIFI